MLAMQREYPGIYALLWRMPVNGSLPSLLSNGFGFDLGNEKTRSGIFLSGKDGKSGCVYFYGTFKRKAEQLLLKFGDGTTHTVSYHEFGNIADLDGITCTLRKTNSRIHLRNDALFLDLGTDDGADCFYLQIPLVYSNTFGGFSATASDGKNTYTFDIIILSKEQVSVNDTIYKRVTIYPRR